MDIRTATLQINAILKSLETDQNAKVKSIEISRIECTTLESHRPQYVSTVEIELAGNYDNKWQ